jgi:DNA polymerase-3 subunit chi
MTRVDFYVLQDISEDAAMRFACRLCLKAMQGGIPVHIQLDNEDQVSAMDDLLWDYPKNRFIAHHIVSAKGQSIEDQSEQPLGADALNSTDIKSPVHLSCGAPIYDNGLLINLASQVPSFFGRFDRVAEIIVEETKYQGRGHYKYYRERGFPLHHHEMKDWEN